MASIQPGARHYPATHLKRLMDSMNGQARTWDDVLDYLQNPAKAGANLPGDELPELINDVRHLKEDNVHFTTDYREMWKELTGEPIENQPREPAASSRVLDVLRRVESKEYKAMASRMNGSDDDAGWLGRH